MQGDHLFANQGAASEEQYGAGAVETGIHDREDVVIHCHQAAGTVLLRLAMINPAIKTTAENAASTPIEGQSGSRVCGAEGNIASSRAFMPYARGFAHIRPFIQAEAPFMGKSAPESSHKGIRKRLMTAWKPWDDSILQAIQKLRAVRANAIRKVASATVSNWVIPKRMPMNGAMTRNSRP